MRHARRWRSAAAAFDELGSPGWADVARSELARVGARRPAPEGGLTAGRTTGGRARRPRAREQGDRPGDGRQRQDGRVPPLEHVREARHPVARRARADPGVAGARGRDPRVVAPQRLGFSAVSQLGGGALPSMHVTEFLAELYVPRTTADAVGTHATGRDSAAAELTRGRNPGPSPAARSSSLRTRRACSCSRPPSIDAVRETARRAALSFEHIAEAAADASWSTDTSTRLPEASPQPRPPRSGELTNEEERR